MKSTTSNWLLRGIILPVAALGFSGMAMAQGSVQDIAVDSSGNRVVDSRGNCVLTQWESGTNPCANEVAEKVVVRETISPARKLTRDQRTVLFDFDKANLDDAAKQNLSALSGILKADAQVKQARIVGYADPIGNAEYNKKLSEHRAAAVRDYIHQQGYFNTAIAEVRGLGDTNQFANCDHVKNRNEKISCLRPNRRVEVELDFVQ